MYKTTIFYYNVIYLKFQRKRYKITVIIDNRIDVCYTVSTMKNNAQQNNVSILNSHRIAFSASLFLCNISLLGKEWYAKDEICNYTKLYYILDGEIDMSIYGNKIIATKGDFLLIPAGTKHEYKANEFAKLYWADVASTFNNNNIAEVLSFPYKVHIGTSTKLITLFKQLIATKNATSPLNSIYQANYISQILTIFFDNCVASVKNKEPTNDIIYSLLKYINEHSEEQLTVAELAQKACMSTSHFTVRFKKVAGVTPHQYINNLKMKKAENLLESTDMSIDNIVRQLNFYDTSYFCKSFKKMYGFSPLQYRKLAQKSTIIKIVEETNE